ncbi:hypothetical protein [Streptomyces sp. NPDC090029]|uniref:hypothetical protein n=1 Tax=Streptomyces sp. NPDC090029 TaxID=3365924 RepID=UPI0037F2023B
MATQHTSTPSFANRAVRSLISSTVIGDSCASHAIRRLPSGEDAMTSARQAPSGPRTSSSAWYPAARTAVANSSFNR